MKKEMAQARFELSENVVTRIEMSRESHELSVSDAAKLLGLNYSSYNTARRGQHPFSLDSYLIMAGALNVSISDLLNEDVVLDFDANTVAEFKNARDKERRQARDLQALVRLEAQVAEITARLNEGDASISDNTESVSEDTEDTEDTESF